MDFIVILLVLLPVLLILFYVGLWVGFRIMPDPEVPELEPAYAVTETKIQDQIPGVVKHYLSENIGDPALVPETVVVWGRGRIASSRVPFFGTMWLPMVWVMFLVPGEAMVLRSRVTVFKRTFFRSVDSYVDGRGGRFTASSNVMHNNNVSRSEETLAWLYSLIFAPSIVLMRPGLQWEILDDDTVLLKAPSQTGGDLEFRLVFDREKAELVQIETTRPTAKEGKPLPYRIECSGSKQYKDMVFLPEALHSVWENDPFQRFQVEGVLYNADISAITEEEANNLEAAARSSESETTVEVVETDDVENDEMDKQDQEGEIVDVEALEPDDVEVIEDLPEVDDEDAGSGKREEL